MRIKYQQGNVTGGYSFSANTENITLPSFVEELEKEDQELVIFEATKAREIYKKAVENKRAAGEKVNPLTLKRESVAQAIKETAEQFGETEYNKVKALLDSKKGGTKAVNPRETKAKAPMKDVNFDDFELDALPPSDIDEDTIMAPASDPFEEI